MTENVQTAMFEVLKRIQADMAEFRVETNMRLMRSTGALKKDARFSASIVAISQAC